MNGSRHRASLPGWAVAVALAGTVAVGPVSMTMYFPALPAIREAFGSSLQVVQSSLSLPLIGIVVAAPLSGSLADRMGRRPVVLLCLAFLVLGVGLCLIAWNVWLLILGRIVIGVAGTCVTVVGRAAIQDAYPAARLSGAMARYALVAVGAMMAAALWGGVATDWFGWRAVFATLLVVTVALAIETGLVLPETLVVGSGTARRRRMGRWRGFALVRSPAFWTYTGQSVFHFSAAVTFVAQAPHLMVDGLGLTASDYGVGLLLVVASMAAGIALSERSEGRRLAGNPFLIGSAAALAGATIMPVMLWFGQVSLSPVLLFAPAMAMAVGVGFAFPASQAGIVGAVPALSGLASGLSSGLQMLGAAVFVQVAALPASRPELVLGTLVLALMAIAMMFALVPALPGRKAMFESD